MYWFRKILLDKGEKVWYYGYVVEKCQGMELPWKIRIRPLIIAKGPVYNTRRGRIRGQGAYVPSKRSEQTANAGRT